MKIFVQVTKGNKYELEVNQHTSIEEARDLLIKNYEEDFKNNLPSQSNNSIVIKYNFVYNGKYLFDPDPFSTLKENSRVILYIKKSKARGLVQLEIVEESEHEEEDAVPPNQDVRQSVIRAANASLVAQVFNPRNNFWDHSLELSRVENALQGASSQGAHYISSSFLDERFHQLFRYNDINIGTILNVMGGGPLLTFGNGQIQNNENNNDNDNDGNANNNIDNSDENFERRLYNNRIYFDYNNTPTNVDELEILLLEMPTAARERFDTLLNRIRSIPKLEQILEQIGTLKVTQIFKESGYDIEKSIHLIESMDQESNQNDNTNSTNNDN